MASKKNLPASPGFDALKWRCIGPSRGGRVVAVSGDPVNKMVFYFGACAGGIWKTEDGGVFWRCVSDGFMGTSAVGSIAVAPSDPNVIYAGTGETAIRLDVSYGDGIYKSTDAGRSWKHIGLKNSKFIGRICIHPQNPDLVYVAVLGDVFGPNSERGVYRSKDGGATWERILYRSDVAGTIDLTMDPNNPRLLFASMWEAKRNFWNVSSGGPGSGLFRSTDGGDTWEEISTKPGLPTGMLGKIGVSISPARSGRVWALVEAEGDKTGLYRSDDFGMRWTMVSPNRDLMHRPWYYTHVFADPGHGDTVYVTNLQMWKSTDGGTTFSEVTTRHGDNHDLWIDPKDPSRMIEGNDGGANISFNGGATWSTIYNQKTAQFYRIDVDNQYPYRVYGTQQDNTSISVPSASEWGVITLADCSYPGTGESGFIAVDPRDHNIVYVGAIGSSPGGAGALQRYDHRTRQIQLVNVWPEESTGIAPEDLKYRFAWTFPIVFSPHDPGTLYAGGNCVFRTRDEGMNWERISPDLSLNDRKRQGASGGPITRESAGAEVHATCACVVESPHRRDEIWASTDDGLVHVTRDGGKSWKDVTPKGMPELAYVGCVEVSAHDADTIYVAATRYKLADYRPHLFKSTDGGRSWKSINGNLPKDEISRVVRADAVAKGLLYVGTETGIHFSLDDGATWTRMAGLPNVPVYDMKLKDSDLVAATHGRSFWILDDVTALRGLADGRKGTRLFAPRTAIRTKLHWSAGANVRTGVAYGPAFGIDGSTVMVERADGTRYREHLDVGENPPNGAIVYYWLSEKDTGPVTLTFRDSSRAQDRRLHEQRHVAVAGAAAGRQARAQPLRLGHEVSRADQAGLRPGAAAAQAPGARSREPAGPDGGARHLRRRADRGREGQQQEPRRQVHGGQGPATAHHGGRIRRAVRPAQGADRVGVEAETGGQSPAQDEAPARGGDRPSRQGRARAQEPRRGYRPQALGHRERDGRSASQVGARRAAQSGGPQRHADRHGRHGDDRRPAADHPDEGGVARGHGQGRQRGRQVRSAGEGRHRPAQRGARQGPREARDGGVGVFRTASLQARS